MPSYKEEVIGRWVAILFEKSSGEVCPYCGRIQTLQTSSNDGGRSLETRHLIVFHDGEEVWFDLEVEEEMKRLTWVKNCDSKPAATAVTRTPAKKKKKQRRAEAAVAVAKKPQRASKKRTPETAAVATTVQPPPTVAIVTPVKRKYPYSKKKKVAKEIDFSDPTEPIEGGWPPGWKRRTFQRCSGATKGTDDKYWYSPVTNKKFRSLTEVKRFRACLKLCSGDEEQAWIAFKGK